MSNGIDRIFKKLRARIKRQANNRRFNALYAKYGEFTMVPHDTYLTNLEIVLSNIDVPGCVVECGVWRGGMSASIAEVLGRDRQYFLFDSFEGLPPAKDIDGPSALAWQSDKYSPQFNDNCRAEMAYAQSAMQLAQAQQYQLIKGWFNSTLPNFCPPEPISILRLDGDWYESTTVCLESLFHFMANRGVIIVDDYYTWDGCSRAVYDFLSSQKLDKRISEINSVCVIRT